MSEQKNKGLIYNSFIYAIGSVGSKLISFLLVPIVSFYLSKDELGIYDLVQTSINLLVPLFTLQISNAVYRWLLDKEKLGSRDTVIYNGLIVTTLGWLFFSIIYVLISALSKGVISTPVAVLIMGGNSYFILLQFIVRGLGGSKVYAVSGIINSMVLLLCTFLSLKVLNYGLEGLFYAIIISNIVASIFLCWKVNVFRYIWRQTFSIKELKDMLDYALPLIPNQISWWMINAADKYIILMVLSTEMNGIYAISTRFPSILTLLNSIFIMAWQDHTITNMESSKEENTKVFNNYAMLQFILVLLLIPISEFLVKNIVDMKFYESYKYMPLLYIGVLFSSLSGYFGAIYLRNKSTKGIFSTTIIGGVINLLISYFFMKSIGLYASALGTFVSFVVVLILRIRQTKGYFDIDVPYKSLIGLTGLSLLYSFIAISFDMRINLWLFVITFFSVVLINREFLFKIGKNIIKKL